MAFFLFVNPQENYFNRERNTNVRLNNHTFAKQFGWWDVDYATTVNLSSMIPIRINSATYFFSIVHVTRQANAKLIYGLLLNSEIYYLSKSLGLNDCVQLDSHALLQPELLDEICEIITTFETAYEKYPSLEFVNEEIIKELAIIRKLVLECHLPAGPEIKRQSSPGGQKYVT